jgi:hypothetical protein
MNIYLDIDGVLRTYIAQAAPYVDEFLQAVLAKYPDSTYWLTTHYWQGQDTTRVVLEPVLRPETVKLLDKIKPSMWGEFKTDGIDFSKPFLWFDDEFLYDEEREALLKHGALENHVLVDLYQNPDQLHQLTEKYFA